MKQIILNTSGERADVIVDNQDPMKVVIRCPNCGNPVQYGRTMMISGYVGCDSAYGDGICYWDDLMPRVVNAQKQYGTQLYQDYVDGKLYSKGVKK